MGCLADGLYALIVVRRCSLYIYGIERDLKPLEISLFVPPAPHPPVSGFVTRAILMLIRAVLMCRWSKVAHLRWIRGI